MSHGLEPFVLAVEDPDKVQLKVQGRVWRIWKQDKQDWQYKGWKVVVKWEAQTTSQVTFGKAQGWSLVERHTAHELKPPPLKPERRFEEKYVRWLKEQKEKFSADGGKRAAAPKRILTETVMLDLQSRAQHMRSFSTGWSGPWMKFDEVPFVLHDERAQPQLRLNAHTLHAKRLPAFSQVYGGQVHEAKGQRTLLVVMPGLKPPPGKYKSEQLLKPTREEEAVLRELMQFASSLSGRPVEHMSELVLLLAGPGMAWPRWHVDSLRQFLGCMLNVSPHPVLATQFVKASPTDLAFGICGRDSKVKRDAIDAQWEVAAQETKAREAGRSGEEFYTSAGLLQPGSAIHTHPLHVHRAPPMPPLQEEGGSAVQSEQHHHLRSTRGPAHSVTDEKDLRRLFFITYGKEVRAEAHAWFEKDVFVRHCSALTKGYQEQEPEKKAKKA